MSRYPRWPLSLLLGAAFPATAQDPSPPERIDLLEQARAASDADFEECTQAERDTAAISGEIVVCRRRADDAQHRTLSREAAQRRYAEETMYAGDPRAPDFSTSCAKNPGGACIKFGSVPPPAIMIDVEALPAAPAGSDADRIARGLPPLGEDGAAVPDPAVNPAGSASPEGQR